MPDSMLLTEELLPKEFIAQSLDGKVYAFSTKQTKGALFYLPEGPTLGGDHFILFADDQQTSVILCDFPEKREEARKVIKEFNAEYLAMVDELRKPDCNAQALTERLYDIEKKLGKELKTQSAVTIARMGHGANIYYFNGGENFLLVYDSTTGKLEKPARGLKQSPKLGVMSSIPRFSKNDKQCKDQLTFTERKIYIGDRILVATDGVGEIPPGISRQHLEEQVEKCVNQAPEHIVGEINKWNKENLIKCALAQDQRVPDDYTIIAFELL